RTGPVATVVETLERADLVAVQTPQAFDAALLRRAHETALRDGVVADDDCALVEHLGAPVAVVEGDPRNLKITRPADLAVLRAALGEREG
ncbi:MAG TPA: 2-C-methyl-D-erythritol 4-phosphate cytidylyltransferase, partial [Candidatus Dormibacteraeota bacterium]